MPHATTIACLPCKLCQLVWTIVILLFLGVVLVPLFGLGWKYMHWDDWRREDETLSVHPITSMSFYRITRHDIAIGLVPFIILVLLYALISMIITGMIAGIANIICCCFSRAEQGTEVSASETQRLATPATAHTHHNQHRSAQVYTASPGARDHPRTIRSTNRISLFDNMYSNV